MGRGARLGVDERGGGHDSHRGVRDGVAGLEEEAVEAVEEHLAELHVVLQHHIERRLRRLVVRGEHVLLHPRAPLVFQACTGMV